MMLETYFCLQVELALLPFMMSESLASRIAFEIDYRNIDINTVSATTAGALATSKHTTSGR